MYTMSMEQQEVSQGEAFDRIFTSSILIVQDQLEQHQVSHLPDRCWYSRWKQLILSFDENGLGYPLYWLHFVVVRDWSFASDDHLCLAAQSCGRLWVSRSLRVDGDCSFGFQIILKSALWRIDLRLTLWTKIGRQISQDPKKESFVDSNPASQQPTFQYGCSYTSMSIELRWSPWYVCFGLIMPGVELSFEHLPIDVLSCCYYLNIGIRWWTMVPIDIDQGPPS